ncbi:hypothetical protein V5O48_000064 [Marasmius crinis-equi]|uniref:Uncharacterized protein n=1 Tax=Marasmius crinis-equi TaxID=585013 RepID=A0ABR3G327_9AGAR
MEQPYTLLLSIRAIIMNGHGFGVEANALEHRQLGGILSGVLGGAGTLVSQVGDGVTSAVGGVTSAVGGVLTPILPPSTTTCVFLICPQAVPEKVHSLTRCFLQRACDNYFHVNDSDGFDNLYFFDFFDLFYFLNFTFYFFYLWQVFKFKFKLKILFLFLRHTDLNLSNPVTSSTESTPAPPPKSFLQNKPLSGFVFALCGIVGLILIIFIITFTMRRSRRRKLENEAISYDPGRGSYNDDLETRLVDEKGGGSGAGAGAPLGRTNSGSTTSHGYGGYAQNAQRGYYDQRIPAYGQYPNYAPRSPNSYEAQQQSMYPSYANYSSAGVAVPQPPRSPNPTYDANPGHISSELYRSNTRSSNGSETAVPASPLPPIPSSLLNGGAVKSPPPVTANRAPAAPQLPPTFGGNGSIDERQGVPPVDLRVSTAPRNT